MAIKAIIFDLGNVLIQNPNRNLITQWAKLFEVDEQVMRQALRRTIFQAQVGALTEEEVWKGFEEDTGKHVEGPQYASIFRKHYHEIPGMIDLARSLTHDYKVALLSNIEFATASVYKEQGYNFFDVEVLSCEVKMRKPNKKIYDYTIAQLEVNAEEAVFIDDKEDNIRAARDAGLQGIVFESKEQLISELKKMEITVNQTLQ